MKKNQIIFLTLIFCIFHLNYKQLFAEESISSLKGRVQSEGKLIPFVSVHIAGTSMATTTNESGEFTFESIPYDNLVIKVQGIGFKTGSFELSKTELTNDLKLEIEPDLLMLEQVTVSGSRVGLLRYLPGSASIVNTDDIKTIMPISGNDIFRTLTGVHVVEEEGAGLRANIGIRGLDPDKSRNVLMLEDGIPVALAPYGEPEMYFTPNIQRMNGVEVLKGSGSILFGPQTIGGVINYLTADPPLSAQGQAAVSIGGMGYSNMQVDMGNTINDIGFKVNLNRKQADNFGPTRFLFHDINAKILANFSPVSRLAIKLGVYDESSNSTYIGLTQPLFEAGNADDLRISPDDVLNIRRYAISASHRYLISDGLELKTNVFGYTTTRNWNRQDFTYDSGASNLTGVNHGLENGYQGAIYLRNSTGQRNRQFEVAGVEPRLSYQYKLSEYDAKLDVGARFLYERAYEQRVNGTMAGVGSGNLRDDEIRTGIAASSYIQNKMVLGENLSVTAGLRSENIWYDREIMRVSFKDTLIMAGSQVSSLIPGMGFNYNFSGNFGTFAGVHRGFAPPRTKDAISNEGVDLQLDAEKSWNYEAGIRSNLQGINLEFTAFYMNFSNQVIPVSESSGGAGAGYINGGATLHRGLELSLNVPFSAILPSNWDASLLWNGTWVRSEFTSDRFILQKKSDTSELDDIFVNVKGNSTPYAPDITMSFAAILKTPWGIGARFSGNYTGAQYSDVLNTENVYDWIALNETDTDYSYVQATTNGRIGKLDPFWVANLSLWYELGSSGLTFDMGVKNIFNERYIVSRRPQGIRAGLPRFFSLGVSYGF